MDAQKYLEAVKEKKEFYESKRIELYSLWCLSTNMTAPLKADPVQSSGDKDRIGTLTDKRIDYEKEVVAAAEQDFLSYRENCIKLLEQLKQESFICYKVLHRKYIGYESLKSIAQKENYSYQRIKELHTEGLKKFQKILDFLNVHT